MGGGRLEGRVGVGAADDGSGADPRDSRLRTARHGRAARHDPPRLLQGQGGTGAEAAQSHVSHTFLWGIWTGEVIIT